MTKTIKLIVEITLEDMTEAELLTAGYDPSDDPDMDPPSADEVTDRAMRDAITYTLQQDEVQAEMFAGTGLFCTIGSVKVTPG